MNPRALSSLPARRAAADGLLPIGGNPIRHVAGSGVILRDRRETEGAPASLGSAQADLSGQVMADVSIPVGTPGGFGSRAFSTPKFGSL